MKSKAERAALLQEIEKYKIAISPDPTVTGLNLQYAIIEKIDSNKDRVGSIFSEALEDVGEIERVIRSLKEQYRSREVQEMNKDTIKILKSADLRESAVQTLLTRELDLISKAENDEVDARVFRDRVNVAYSDIKAKLDAIKNQLGVLYHLKMTGQEGRGTVPGSIPGAPVPPTGNDVRLL